MTAMSEAPIYLDHAATTPVDPEVAEAMLPFISGPLSFGNPSSIHSYGRAARAAVDEARDRVAKLVGADYGDVYFTASGTEADNLALMGAMLAAPAPRNHLITSVVEHHAVLRTAWFLETQGWSVTQLPVDNSGLISSASVSEAILDRTTLVSIMHANNEIGTVQPVAEFSRLARERGALFHTDAVQTAGILEMDFRSLGCDLLSLSAHKMYGPKGVGALVVRQGTRLSPIVHGGSQEREKRAGTENVAAIVGFGVAADIALGRRNDDAERLVKLRDYFVQKLTERIPGIRLNGSMNSRLPNNVNVSIDGKDGPTLLMNLDRHGVAASSGSACSSGSIEPSHVLKAIGLPDGLASSGIRFTLGRSTTREHLDIVVGRFGAIVDRLRLPVKTGR